MPKLTRALIEKLEPRAADYSVRDTQVIGLGVRVRPAGSKTFILTYRLGGQLRKLTLGRADNGYGLDEARDRAREKLADVRDGMDPQIEKVAERHALTVDMMIDHYMKAGPALKPNKKASSWETNRTIFDCHVRPLIGRRLARDLTRLDVAKMQLDVSQGKTVRNVKTGYRKRSRVTGGKRVAAMAVITLGAAYEFAILTDMLKANPTKGVERFQTIRRERYLSDREIAAISEALAQFEREEVLSGVMGLLPKDFVGSRLHLGPDVGKPDVVTVSFQGRQHEGGPFLLRGLMPRVVTARWLRRTPCHSFRPPAIQSSK